ncbi:hypothetical protein N7478_011386 [Penicillium angulare]|uniref:uncharacterized protein n=1 Tax=Penicillium angulare TaxID=116970 RepID=UPI002540DFA9|nr:uncharacterized protein N7478_011386 [Penicillium angulare]KAJ5263781.1 hypothetical protein N7478_011386 [Penicillium angulare]
MLHNTWKMLVQTAKVTPAISPEQDKLVLLLITMGALRIFSHRTQSGETESKDIPFPRDEEENDSNLPFLARDLQNDWITKSQDFTSRERESLAAFTAKLYVAGSYDNELSFVGLWLLKNTLEEEIPLRGNTDEGGDKSQHEGSTPKSTIADLLPACFAWLSNANYKLVTMAAKNYSPSPPDFTTSDHGAEIEPRNKAVKANINGPGFSLSRWVFWILRLKELTSCADEEISSLAKQSFDVMIHTSLVLGIDVHGEKNYFDKVHEALDVEFKARGMTGCVDASDISIYFDWAD